MEVLHGVDFLKKKKIVGMLRSTFPAQNKKVSRCFVPNKSPFWDSMVDRDRSQGNINIHPGCVFTQASYSIEN